MNISRAGGYSLCSLAIGAAVAVLLMAGRVAVAADAPAAEGTGNVALNPAHPDSYVVKKGDTLWDISAMFLKDPWYWPEIWEVNPQIKNPHLIYPGDVLTLVYDGSGKPRLQVTRPGGETAATGTEAPARSGGTDKLSPRIREQDLADAIPAVPLSVIGPFLTRGRIIERGELSKLPHIVVVRDEHLLGAAGNEVYVKGKVGGEGQTYSVVHVGQALREPGSWRVFGYQGTYIGDGTIRRGGNPATLFLNSTTREALAGDRLVSQSLDFPSSFVPHAPAKHVEGRIMAVMDGVENVPQYQVIIINRGSRDGLEAGHVLKIWQRGHRVLDRNAGILPRNVKLPDESAGVSMVFRTYDRISYALVMQATNGIHLRDKVRSPD